MALPRNLKWPLWGAVAITGFGKHLLELVSG